MGHSTIADIDEIAGADLARLAETPTLDDMRQMDSEAKLRLLAYCVASQITSLSFHSDRDRQLATIVGAAQIDIDRKRTRLNSSHKCASRMPATARQKKKHNNTIFKQ